MYESATRKIVRRTIKILFRSFVPITPPKEERFQEIKSQKEQNVNVLLQNRCRESEYPLLNC